MRPYMICCTDCNLNGVCMPDTTCNCTNPNVSDLILVVHCFQDGKAHFCANHLLNKYEGIHCQLETPCPQIISESTNSTWTANVDVNCENYLYEYGRMAYRLTKNGTVPESIDYDDDNLLNLIYVGR